MMGIAAALGVLLASIFVAVFGERLVMLADRLAFLAKKAAKK